MKHSEHVNNFITPTDRLISMLDDLKSNLLLKHDTEIYLKKIETIQNFITEKEQYLLENCSPHSKSLDYIQEHTMSGEWIDEAIKNNPNSYIIKEMLSGPRVGQFLKLLVKISNSKSVLDIGMFTGYSSLSMAEGLQSGPGSQVIACEENPTLCRLAKDYFKRINKEEEIQVIQGKALETLSTLSQSNKTFDFIFIDAAKPQYQAYLDFILKTNLLRKDGIICIDNTLYQGLPWSEDCKYSKNGLAIRQFNNYVKSLVDLDYMILPIRDGLSILKYKDSK